MDCILDRSVLNEAIKAGILYKGSSAADLKTYWEND